MHKIEIYNILGQDSVTMSSSCSSCSSGCEPVTHTISQTINAFTEKYADVSTIERHQLGQDNLDHIAEKLQALYTNSGEQLIITSSNVQYILGKLSPIIAINDRLAANNYVPDADELKFAIDHNGGIYSSICD